MKYGYTKKVDLMFDEAVEALKKELKKEGFGVLTEIDVQQTLKEKIDVDYDKYVILGACNPPFAYQALESEKQVGLLLPCNIIIYEDKKSVKISAILPTVAMGIVDDNEKLKEIADQIETKLKKVINNLK